MTIRWCWVSYFNDFHYSSSTLVSCGFFFVLMLRVFWCGQFWL